MRNVNIAEFRNSPPTSASSALCFVCRRILFHLQILTEMQIHPLYCKVKKMNFFFFSGEPRW